MAKLWTHEAPRGGEKKRSEERAIQLIINSTKQTQ